MAHYPASHRRGPRPVAMPQPGTAVANEALWVAVAVYLLMLAMLIAG